jgi:hypothetical protein
VAHTESGSAPEDASEDPLENGQRELAAAPGTGAVQTTATVQQVGEPDPVAGWQDLVKTVLEHATAALGLIGLLVYGVVRVAHDSFYGHFGVAPEDVGLTQATILGRAALYLTFFLAVSGAIAGVWMCGMVPLYRRVASSGLVTSRMRVVVVAAVSGLVLLAGSVAFLAPNLAGVLADSTPADGCDTNRFCTTASLVPDVSLGLVLGVPLGLAALALAISLYSRASTAGLCLVGLLAVVVAAVVPEFFELLDDLAEGRTGTGILAGIGDDLTWLERHPLVIKIGVFAFVFCGLAASCTGLVSRRIRPSTADPSAGTRVFAWAALSLVLVLPAVVGFVAPSLAGFLTESFTRFASALFAWFALLGATLLGLQTKNGSPAVPRKVAFCAMFAVAAASSLFLAWERGKDMAEFAESGNRLVSRHFRLLSVRTDVVCLDPVKRGEALPGARRGPYLYLGQSGGTLVLFDYRRLQDIKRREREEGRTIGAPKTLPVRVPATGAFVQIARIPESTWACPRGA